MQKLYDWERKYQMNILVDLRSVIYHEAVLYLLTLDVIIVKVKEEKRLNRSDSSDQ